MFGSKIDNLKILKSNKFNVPDFLVITYEEYVSGEYIDIISRLKDGLYSVRSSCNLEDGDSESFAGLFDTFLNVKNDDLASKVKSCMNGIHNPSVIEYCRKNNINIVRLEMNVIVQKMVNPSLSGVIFTCNPLGILNETVIVVSKGLGENVVADKGKTTSYYYNTTDNVYYYEGGSLLDDKVVNDLVNLSKKISNIFGEYIDIEFAIEDDEIYVLQTRKITTVNPYNQIILDNSNIVESYPNLSSPLTISFANDVYTLIFKSLIRRILTNKSDLKKLDVVLDNMTDSYNGRMYYRISNWYTLLKYLPFSNKIISIWQDMMGVRIKDTSSNKVKISKLSKIKACNNYIKEVFHAKESMSLLNEEFTSILKYYHETYNDKLTTKELIDIYNKLEKKILKNWDITLINDMYSFLYSGLLKKHLKKKYPKKYETVTNNYISGISNIESLKPIKELINLAYNEKKYTKEEFNELKMEYINKYGDRSLEELKLESKTFRTNPSLLDEKIKLYQKDKDKLNDLYININKTKNTKLDDNFITKKITSCVYSGISNREISRMNRSRIFGMVREIFLSIGSNLVKDKVISVQDDIFYLTKDEIFNIDKNINYKEIINSRKEEYEFYKKMPAYSRIIFQDKVFNKTSSKVNINKKSHDVSVLKGIPASFGICEGEALVIENASTNLDTKNKILITKMTDPGWVFLIANAKGIISEKGSLLSHTAIVSRELNIPSIVGVSGLLDSIHTGDYIKMDANTGHIEITRRSK